MRKCMYPDCKKYAKVCCTCHLDEGYWCYEHIDNHYKAMSLGLKK